MSAIAGIIRFDGAPIEPGMVEKMTSAMAHRGQDGIHHWVNGSLALGQCMLRTTPESLEEKQPLSNEDGSLVLVMDGRVDNWEELRRELLGRGAVLRDRSDAELVLRAYESWGEGCLDRIIGEFVFFILDTRQRRLFGARDAAGTRHFYYHAGDGWFGFASEIKGLLALDLIECRLNESRLLDYLVVEFDRDDEVGTFYQGISRLPAGHALRVSDRGEKTWRYWNPADLPAVRFASVGECAEAFLEQLRIAVKCRLRSIGPVGAMLSGGLDSSSIVGLISKNFRADLTQPLKTFSLIRDDRENCPDWHSIRRILKDDDWLDPTIITSAIAADVCGSYIADIRNLDEPFALSQGFTDSLVFDAAREKGCRVIFDGMAGDLLFFSPERSMECTLRKRMFAQIPLLLAAYRHHGKKNGLRTAAWKSLRSTVPDRLLAVYRKLRDARSLSRNRPSEVPGDLLHFLHPEVARQYLDARLSQRQRAAPCIESSNDQAEHARMFTSGMLSFAHEVNGQNALSRGVEPRSPLSDRRLIEFAVRMPLEAKLSVPWYKPVMRRSMAGILPEEVRLRSAIGGHPGWTFFERMVSAAAIREQELWSGSRISERLAKWTDALRVHRAWEEYQRNGDYCAGLNLFILVTLTLWLDAQPQSM